MNKTYSLDGAQALLSYPFKAAGWQSKLLIGVALFFANYVIPIVPSLFLSGYFFQIMRSVIVDHAEPSLPEWTDWGKLLRIGFKGTAATVIYLMPGLLLLIGGYIVMELPIFLMAFSPGSNYETTSSALGVSMVVGVLVGMVLMVLGFALLIPLSLLLPPAIAHLVAKDSFAAAFRVREWWAILRANPWGFFTALTLILGVYMSLLTIIYAFYFTIILCVVVPILMSVVAVYLNAVAAPILGEAYRKGVENLAAAAAGSAAKPSSAGVS